MPRSTLHDEIRRGTVLHPNTFKDKAIWDYSAEVAQAAIDRGRLTQGRSMKMNTTIAKLLRIEIVENHRSPYDAQTRLSEQGIPNLPSVRSIYDHIHHGDLGISPSQRPYKPDSRPQKASKPRRSLKMPGNLSIEERPDLDDRAEFGHWEMDCKLHSPPPGRSCCIPSPESPRTAASPPSGCFLRRASPC